MGLRICESFSVRYRTGMNRLVWGARSAFGAPGSPAAWARSLVVSAFLALLALASCGGNESGEPAKPKVVAAFYPLEYVARAVSGGRADVASLTPPGVEAHDLELTARQVRQVQEADLLVYLGEGFQPAVEELTAELEARVLDAAALAGSSTRANDPHVWLDPVLMVAIANAVAESLGEVDERNAAAYQRNGEELVGELNRLDDSYQIGLTRCDRRELVTSHEAFGYLAQRFNLEQIGIGGIDIEAEPSAGRLAEIANIVEDRNVTTIFFERPVPSDIAETIARETGAETAELDPIESPPDSGDYLNAMSANLEALRTALGCR